MDQHEQDEFDRVGEATTRRRFLEVSGATVGGVLAASMVGSAAAARVSASGVRSVTATKALKRVGASMWVDAEVHRELIGGMADVGKKRRAFTTGPVLDAGGDGVKQVLQAEALLTQNFSGAFVLNIQPQGWDEWGRKAKREGITTIAVTAFFPSAAEFMRVDNPDAGTKLATAAAKWFKEKHEGEGEWALFELTSIPALTDRTAAMESTMKRLAPGVKLVGKAEAATQETGAKAAASLLAAHPNLKAILCFSDDGMLGGLQAVKEAGRHDPNNFWMGGVDAVNQTLKELENPQSVVKASAAFLWPTLGYFAGQHMVSAFQGKAIPGWTRVRALLVTPRNVDAYRKLIARPTSALSRSYFEFYKSPFSEAAYQAARKRRP
jgi:ABC-type sugar transport system substrate-binding protein